MVENPVSYFDYNATTPLCSEAKAAWLAAQDELWLNPSSPYRAAARVQVHLEAARLELAEFFETVPERVVFNSGATEGNNTVFAYWEAVLPRDARIGLSPTEHPSVLEAAKRYFDDRLYFLPLHEDGSVDPDQIDYNSLGALSVMAANNETGILNPWREIAAASRAAGVVYHCDASQWIGKLPLNEFSICDFVTACAHKFGGPCGVGFCLVPQSAVSLPLLNGGAQESGRRAGTEAVASILAMVAALRTARYEISESKEGRDGFEAALMDICRVIGQSAERLWNTSLLQMPEYASARWVRALEKRGFLVSTGAACASGKDGPSHVLSAMGIDSVAMQRVVRISSGRSTSFADWKELSAAVRAAYEDLILDGRGRAEVIYPDL